MQIAIQIIHRSKASEVIIHDQGRDNGRNREAKVSRAASMTTARPTVLVIRFPDAAEFFGQPLTAVPVAGHTPVPIEIATEIELGWIGGKGRLDQRIVGRGRRGSDTIECSRTERSKGRNDEEKPWKKEENREKMARLHT